MLNKYTNNSTKATNSNILFYILVPIVLSTNHLLGWSQGSCSVNQHFIYLHWQGQHQEPIYFSVRYLASNSCWVEQCFSNYVYRNHRGILLECRFWVSRSGATLNSLHFYQAPRWCKFCSPGTTLWQARWEMTKFWIRLIRPIAWLSISIKWKPPLLFNFAFSTTNIIINFINTHKF